MFAGRERGLHLGAFSRLAARTRRAPSRPPAPARDRSVARRPRSGGPPPRRRAARPPCRGSRARRASSASRTEAPSVRSVSTRTRPTSTPASRIARGAPRGRGRPRSSSSTITGRHATRGTIATSSSPSPDLGQDVRRPRAGVARTPHRVADHRVFDGDRHLDRGCVGPAACSTSAHGDGRLLSGPARTLTPFARTTPRPCRQARRTASTFECTPSFARMFFTWLCTVSGLMDSGGGDLGRRHAARRAPGGSRVRGW